MMQKQGFQWLLLILMVVGVSSCVRERDYNIEMVKEGQICEFIYNNALSIIDDAATKNTGDNLANYKTSGFCATLTHDTIARTIVVDFGMADCMCNDGRTRKGKILAQYTQKYFTDGNHITINFDHYFVNDIQVFGESHIIQMGKNLLNQTYFNIENDGKILKYGYPDTIYWNTLRTRTWIQGESTPVWGDDIYQLEGTGFGKNANLYYYSMNITEPLLWDLSCRFIHTGTIELQPQGKALRTLYYGKGNCENQSSVTLNNKSFYLELF